MDWRIRVPGAVYRLAVDKLGSDTAVANLVRDFLATYVEPESRAAAIRGQAAQIAGALWDDRQRVGSLADQLRVCAAASNAGSDGDLTEEDRAALRTLADEAERRG